MNPVNPTNLPPQSGKSAHALMNLAQHAVEQGDASLGMHLYLAAFEQAQSEDQELAQEGLRQAWDLAVDLKERSIAEYIFEKIESHLSPDDLVRYSDSLQRLSLEKLADFGLTPDDLNTMASTFEAQLSNGFMAPFAPTQEQEQEDKELNELLNDAFEQTIELREEDSETAPESGTDLETEPESTQDKTSTQKRPSKQDIKDALRAKVREVLEHLPENTQAIAFNLSEDALFEELDKAMSEEGTPAKKKQSSRNKDRALEAAMTSLLGGRLSYKDLVGFDSAITTMRDLGIGIDPTNPFYQGFAERLRSYHGISHLPGRNTFLFSSSSREDANHFMAATVAEMGLPCLRMCIEETAAGAPMLCVMSTVDLGASLNQGKAPFAGPGVIMLEDLDMWEVVIGDASPEDLESQGVSNPRGLREILGLIRMSVKNPNIYILASVSAEADLSDTYVDLIAPFIVINMEAPNLHERMAIIVDLFKQHPSLQKFNPSVLASLSSGLARYDLYQAITEAVEEAFQESLHERHVVPISGQNLLSKIASYHEEGSEELRLIEDILVYEFMQELDASTSTTKGTS